MIPQNKLSYFNINKNNNWKYSISITFKHNEDIDYLNLYLIIKSYIINNIYTTTTISTSFLNIESKLLITQHTSLYRWKRMDFIEFEEWITYRLNKDFQYNIKDSLYSIDISFEKNLFEINQKKTPNINLLNELKPIYPWSNNWLNYFKQSISRINWLEKENEMLKELLKK